MAALTQILCQKADENVIFVENYMKAGGEALALTFLVTGIISAYVHPDFFDSNPLKDRLGYNNFCVLFDLPPSSYIGATGIAFTVYLVCMYVRLAMRRLRLEKENLPDWFVNMALAIHYLFGLSMCAFTLVFVIPPTLSAWGHTGVFVQLIFFRWAAVITSYLQSVYFGRTILYRSRVFIVIYTITSVVLPILYFVNFYVYDTEHRTGVDPYLPAWITASFDYLWFVCLALTTQMLPESPPLRETFRLAERTFELPNGMYIPLSKWKEVTSMPLTKAGSVDEKTSDRQALIPCPVLACLYRHKAIIPDEKGVVDWIDLAKAVCSYTGCRRDVLEKILRVAFKDTSDEFKEPGCRLFELVGRVQHGYATGCRANKVIKAHIFDELEQKYAVTVDELEDSKHNKRFYLDTIHDVATFSPLKALKTQGCSIFEERKAAISFSALFEAFRRSDPKTSRPYLSAHDLRLLLLEGCFPVDYHPHPWGLKDVLDEIAVVSCGCPQQLCECFDAPTRNEELAPLTSGKQNYHALELQK
eukprot:CAMPEP_0184493340 /NCGR_PEP_ID=MMETSP0113_2-20130426/25743_1 /TAXON_ID=91329 /ORGANISM="Norrisiella sphaerica, Strain BC52" /LENGTH=529 /DNA_ID=CAMNT_0026878563 /DNA_START=130 /DNA_END=1719 /DNA_ORIENTATION=-